MPKVGKDDLALTQNTDSRIPLNRNGYEELKSFERSSNR